MATKHTSFAELGADPFADAKAFADAWAELEPKTGGINPEISQIRLNHRQCVSVRVPHCGPAALARAIQLDSFCSIQPFSGSVIDVDFWGDA